MLLNACKTFWLFQCSRILQCFSAIQVEIYIFRKKIAQSETLNYLIANFFQLSWPINKFHFECRLRSYSNSNLQYNTLGRWVDGPNDSSTKRLMFQVLFCFHNFLQILCKNPFNLFISFLL